MKILTDTIARLLFGLPFALFGIFHFMYTDAMAGIPPFGGAIMVYITGACLIAAAIAIIIKKQASLATLLLGIFLILTATLVHLSAAMEGDPGNMLKDLALSGAAFFMSGVFKEEEEGSLNESVAESTMAQQDTAPEESTGGESDTTSM